MSDATEIRWPEHYHPRNTCIAWNGKAARIDVYHAWLIAKMPSGGAVISAESLHGFTTRLSARVFANRMWKFHQIWLAGLRDNCMTGIPR
jgi:hypothetical protein